MDENVGIAGLGGGIVLLLAAIFSYTRDLILLIGVGTAISLTIGVSKLYLDTREYRRRKRNELIDKLQPRIYDTATTWAVKVQQTLLDEPDYELMKNLESPPNFSNNLYYIGIVGKTLKSHFEGASHAYAQWDLMADGVIREYRDRLLQEIKKSGHTTELWRANIVIDGAQIRVDSIAGNHTILYMRNWLSKAKEVKLKLDQPQGGSKEIPCSKEVLDIIQHPENLPSFPELRKKRKNLLEAVEVPIKYLEEIVKHGEKDWRT